MDRTLSIIILFGSFFIAMFLLSLLAPGSKEVRGGNPYYTSLIAQYGEMEDQIKEEQDKYYRSREADEELYYRTVEPPQNIDQPDYFMEPHPLEERPLEELPLEERPLQERPLQERPLQERPLR